MALPPQILESLRGGKSVAAELTSSGSHMRAFVVVIPDASRQGFEIRFLEHDAKYTDTGWGWDYDHALDDETTRVRRVFVEREGEIEQALKTWLADPGLLRSPDEFESCLIHSPLEHYLSRPEKRPHLWR